MRPVITLLILILLTQASQAQSDPYKGLWKKVESLDKQGLPKSALQLVEQIESKADADKNSVQQIRALLYKSKYALTLEEDAQLKIIKNFQEKISTSSPPVKNLLQNMLANLYWQYFQQHRYQFYNRTNTTEKPSDDFRTWDLETIFNEIHEQFQASLENEPTLQSEAISKYNDLLIQKENSDIYRPTLYDLLAQNALKFYKTNENSITKAAESFELDKPEYLIVAETFKSLDINTDDKTSLQYNALRIYQKLINFHLERQHFEALVDVDIDRLQFVKRHTSIPNLDALYLETLEASQAYTNDHSACALYQYEMAALLTEQGHQYDAKNAATHHYRWKLKEALELCNSTMSQFKNSRGAQKCEVLKQQIHNKNLNILSESCIPINTYSKVLVEYSNIEDLNFQVFQASLEDIKAFRKIYRPDQQRAYLDKKTADTTFISKLRNEGDYQNHSTEVILPQLKNGHYFIRMSAENDRSIFATQILQVTDFAVVDHSTNTELIYQIIDRTNGSPVTNASVAMSYEINYSQVYTKKTFSTDSEGTIKMPKSARSYSNLSLQIFKNKQSAYFENFYAYSHEEDSKKTTQYNAFLFTDRSIYRPGQTLFFKGIAMQTSNDMSSVIANELVDITLRNVNWEEVATLQLKTNEFGSVASEFILPEAGLTGTYTLEINSKSLGLNAQRMISVEEYKRPKFEVTFEPVFKTYRVNDSIQIEGVARAYAGSNISNAKVIYRVHRKIQWPRWHYWSRPFYNSQPQEITHGEIVTDSDGTFRINFKALPDSSVDRKNQPIFKYEVTADVIDINGETRSNTTIVNVGYHALTVAINAKESMDSSIKDHKISIATSNLNGVFVKKSVLLKIVKLKAPDRVLIPRSWPAPDYQIISENTFVETFPHEAYRDESSKMSWEEGKTVFEKQIDTEESKDIDLGSISTWDSGAYKIIVTTEDRFGNQVKDEVITTVHNDTDEKVLDQQLFEIKTDKNSYTVGSNVLLSIGSAAEHLEVYIAIEKDKKIVKTFMVPLQNSKRTIAIPVTKDDLGGFVIHYSYAAFNYFKSGKLYVDVPYPESDLSMETINFRDRLQPGTEESWSFKIKGPKGEKVASELLASMYDASLDQFLAHDWNFNPMPNQRYYSSYHFNANQSFRTNRVTAYDTSNPNSNYKIQEYDQLDWFGLYFENNRNIRIRGVSSPTVQNTTIEMVEDSAALEEVAVVGYATKKEKGFLDDDHENGLEEPAEKKNLDGIIPRNNLQETAFFFPQLTTDAEGNVRFTFTAPEALTQWKLQLLAHSKSLESAVSTLTTITQKELMVIPNVPRFLRQGDKIHISSKISNLTDKAITGDAQLILTDVITNKDISSRILINNGQNQVFSVDAEGNTQVSWALTIPEDLQAIQYKILAKSGKFSDGEQNVLPVLSNRTLITETLAMWVKGKERKTFTLDKLKTNASKTLKQHQLTLEMTSNPAWYAVQSLPYLMEYPYDCNEQTFSRYYANALASHIANSNQRIRDVFNQWKNSDALISNLEKNQELKAILIQETPWLRDAESESEQKKRMALLFDINKMNSELSAAQRKLQQNQLDNGAWPWFKGGRPNRYITQYIITGFGHLAKLNVNEIEANNKMIHSAIKYLDEEFVKEYKDLKKYNKNVDLTKDHLSPLQIHYLYMRSFFPEIKKTKELETITHYYLSQIKSYWLSKNLYSKGMMALIASRHKDLTTSHKILKSLKESSITSEELGMYWKENTASWFWYQAPIETQALMVEAFSEINEDTETIDNLKIWLLKNKQTNSWKTTKATADAIYALLLEGGDWLSVTETVDVVLGGQPINPVTKPEIKVESGTGYYKTSWNASEITPEMATVTMSKKGNGVAWGSLYWQYFEDLDQISAAKSPLNVKKNLYLKRNSNSGEQLLKIDANTQLQVGDLVSVRLELKTDRDMEFIHMKDMRAAGLEPINVLSSYKWQDGLGYYESTKDAATNFFFDYLPKGIYVFEYDLRVNNAGTMSNGITTLQSMYAPEFSSHSEEARITVK